MKTTESESHDSARDKGTLYLVVNQVRDSLRRHASLGVVLLLFLLTIVFVDPLKQETAFTDDWAFAVMARHVLVTGRYQLSDWLAPNSPLHAYWGALFAWVNGYSFGSLRLSTLCLMVVGIISFYALSREYDFSPANSALLSLVLVASPLVLLLSFTFMSDIPFLVYLVTALALYTRAIRQASFAGMFAASIAASAAILVRQTGIVLLPALAAVWFLSANRRQVVPQYVAGSVFPIAAAVWQASAPGSWTSRWFALAESSYVSTPGLVIPQMLWRPMVLLEYLALLILPITLVILVKLGGNLMVMRHQTASNPLVRSTAWLIIIFAVYIIGSIGFGMQVIGTRGILPYLAWTLNDLFDLPQPVLGVLTILTSLGAIALGCIFTSRYLNSRSTPASPTHHYLLDFVAVGSVLPVMGVFSVDDRYFIPVIPYALIVGGLYLSDWLTRHWRPIAALSLVSLVVCAMWVRASFARRSAEWQAAEEIRASGVSAENIVGPIEWDSYQGGFDIYLSSIDYRIALDSRDNYFGPWKSTRLRTAKYHIVGDLSEVERSTWRVIATVPYQDMLFQPQSIYVLERASEP